MNNRSKLFLRAARGPFLLITIGILFAVHQAGELSISRSWPILLIVAGFLILGERLITTQRGTSGVPSQFSPAATPASPYAPAGGLPRSMAARRSIAGPLVVILIGILFLLQTLTHSFSILHLAAFYWPYALIAWGVVQLVEISLYTLRSQPVANYGTSGGGWLLVALICLIGSGLFQFQRSNHYWWGGSEYRHGMAVFGSEHNFAIPETQKAVGTAPQVKIEDFRGDIAVSGASGTKLVLSGRKMIRAMDTNQAKQTNEATPVQVLIRGNSVTVRCDQNKGNDQIPVTASVQLTLPEGASIQVDGQGGDLKVRSIAGEVELRGHGGDIELQKVAGKVTIEGNYEGMVTLRDVAQPIHMENMGTHLDMQRLPGEIRIDRGTFSAQNVVGPVKLNMGATDVTLRAFSQEVDLAVDHGDINLQPSQVPLGKMNVHTHSGDIDLNIPPNSTFTITADTKRGEIENGFGEALAIRDAGRGAHLEGTVGNGAEIHLTTDRGTITLHKVGVGDTAGKKTDRLQAPSSTGSEI